MHRWIPLRMLTCNMIANILAMAAASPALGELLAGYEPEEIDSGLSVSAGGSDPGLVVTWPLVGGIGDVPDATQGNHVLKMEWTGETDRKVEVRHDWAGSTFDLPGWLDGVAEIRADVYIATDSALPLIVGIWDDVFGWTPGTPVPWTKDQWFSVSMNVGHVQQTGLDHIFALLFEDLAGDDGILYIDNLRLVPTRRIAFAGYEWIVKSGHWLGPGPNSFSQDCRNVWVDANGRLHLRIEERWGLWLAAEVVLADSFGHGAYAFTVDSRVDALDDNEILGLFTWDDDAPEFNYREIDFEFSRWGDPGNDNAQFVVQPWDTPGNRYRFDIDYASATDATTHVMNWGPSSIAFSSHYGNACADPDPADVIESWTYSGADNPPPGGENVRINLWLRDGLPPVGGSGSEMIISDFRFRPDGPMDSDQDGVFDDCDACSDTIAGVEVDDAGCPPLIPGDFDRDGDVAADDLEVFESCGTGPAVPHDGSAVCHAADLDEDEDVDGADFSMIQACLSGSGVPADPDCTPIVAPCLHVDSLPALRGAIRNAPPDACIRVAAGVYEVTESIEIARDDITIEGVGDETLFVLAEGTHCPVFVIGEPVPFAPAITRRNVTLRSMRIRGYRFPDPQPEDELCDVPCRGHLRNNGITVRQAEDCLIENVTVENAASGGIVLELACRRIRIRNVESFGHQFDGIAFGGDIQDSVIEDSILRNNTAAGISFDIGPQNNQIIDCEIRDNGDVGAFIRDSDRNCFTACLIAGNGADGVFISDGDALDADAVENAFVDNQYVNNGGHGIWQAGQDSIDNCQTGGSFSGNIGDDIHNSFPLDAPVVTCGTMHACND